MSARQFEPKPCHALKFLKEYDLPSTPNAQAVFKLPKSTARFFGVPEYVIAKEDFMGLAQVSFEHTPKPHNQIGQPSYPNMSQVYPLTLTSSGTHYGMEKVERLSDVYTLPEANHDGLEIFGLLKNQIALVVCEGILITTAESYLKELQRVKQLGWEVSNTQAMEAYLEMKNYRHSDLPESLPLISELELG